MNTIRSLSISTSRSYDDVASGPQTRRPTHHANSTRTQFKNPTIWGYHDEYNKETESSMTVQATFNSSPTEVTSPSSSKIEEERNASPDRQRSNGLRRILGEWNRSRSGSGSWENLKSSLDFWKEYRDRDPARTQEQEQREQGSEPRPSTSRTLSLPNIPSLNFNLPFNFQNLPSFPNIPNLNLNLPSLPFELATPHLNHPHPPIKVVGPTFGLDNIDDCTGAGISRAGDETVIKATWLGHASFLVELSTPCLSSSTPQHTPRVLFDPIFSTRAGPSQWTGIRRRLPPPCKLEDLPPFQYVVISHNHYDHLDLPTIQSILSLPTSKLNSPIKFVVPLGLKSWFESLDIPPERIVEMDWWEERWFDLDSDAGGNGEDRSGGEGGDDEGDAKLRLRFTCVPAQHTSGRSLYDTNATLWASWFIEMFKSESCAEPESEANDENENERMDSERSTSTPTPTLTATREQPESGFSSNTRSTNVKHTKLEPKPRTRTRLAAIYHAGDTGYYTVSPGLPSTSSTSSTTSSNPTVIPNPTFKHLSKTHDPPDLSMIPIWRGGTLSFISKLGLRLLDTQTLSSLHATPSQALSIHQDINSHHTLAMHFATFAGSDIEAFDPIVHLTRERELLKIGNWDQEGGFGVIDIGETAQIIAQSRQSHK